MTALRWRPIAEPPRLVREMTALISCIDEHDTYLLPGPVMWDIGRACWLNEITGEPVRYLPSRAEYRWLPEPDLF